jgi:hypothetical protein
MWYVDAFHDHTFPQSVPVTALLFARTFPGTGRRVLVKGGARRKV